MHDDDRYDLVHAELASGEGMPEARQPHALQEGTTASVDGGGTGLGPQPNA